MKQGKGLSVCEGVAIGKIFVYQKSSDYTENTVDTPQKEQEKFEKALQTATDALRELYEQTKAQFGEEKGAILEVQLLMLQDLDFLDSVSHAITMGESAVSAVEITGKTMSNFFASLEDSYMKERAADVLDVSHRLMDILTHAKAPAFPNEPCIVVANDLSPSETVTFPRDRILGFVTQKGALSGHTAILAKTLGLPSLIQADVPLEELTNNTIMAVDGRHGRWYLNPTKEVLSLLQEQKEKQRLQTLQLQQYQGKPVHGNGKRIYLCANIGSLEDLQLLHGSDADGIGLMRSEFMYLGKHQPPNEEEQFKVYSTVAKTMKEKMVIVRTLDIGADKQVSYLPMEQEENPALGLRGLRLCFAFPHIFETQLRALYRASIYGNLHIMFPMVSSLWEIKKAKAICEDIRNRLVTQGYSVKPIPIGVMIETPAAALISGVLAREVDFFSVGTNDLIQYTLAADRQNPLLADHCPNDHPATMKLLEYVVKNASRAGIWAGVCGELASHPRLAGELVKMGYTELSMPPSGILQIKKYLLESEV